MILKDSTVIGTLHATEDVQIGEMSVSEELAKLNSNLTQVKNNVTELDNNILKIAYTSITIYNDGETDYIYWEHSNYISGRIVSIWNNDRTVSMPAITGYSYTSETSKTIFIHLDSVYQGNVALGILYIPD